MTGWTGGMGSMGVDSSILNNQTVYKIASGGTATAADANKTVAFLNGSNDYIWTMPPGIFSPGNQGEYRKTGAGDITIARGSGVTFLPPGFFGNSDIKIDGGDGYSVYWEMIEEVLESNAIAVLASDIYQLSPEFPTRYVVGQKILISGFTNGANNGVKTIAALPNAAQVQVSETLAIESTGDDITVIPQNTFILRGAIKAAS